MAIEDAATFAVEGPARSEDARARVVAEGVRGFIGLLVGLVFGVSFWGLIGLVLWLV